MYESADGYLLNADEYKILCNNTKIVTQRAVMGANIINFKAQVIYNANGNLIEETFVKWDDDSNQCLAGYTLKGNFENAETTIEVSGQAQSFLNECGYTSLFHKEFLNNKVIMFIICYNIELNMTVENPVINVNRI